MDGGRPPATLLHERVEGGRAVPVVCAAGAGDGAVVLL